MAGLVALLMEHQNRLSPDQIRKKLVDAAGKKPAGKLRPDRRQEADARRPDGKRQSDDMDSVVGAGKARVPGSVP